MGAIRHRRPGLGFILILLPGLLVAACASTASAPAQGVMDEAGRLAPAPAATAAAGQPSDATRGGSQAGGGSSNVPAVAVDDLRIVYTGSLQLVVGDLQPALAKAKAAVLAAGGYIGASQESDDGNKPVATITYRIPATRWEDTIGSLRALATKVVSEQTEAAEVGGQLVDLEARIRNLQASEASLQEIAKGAGKISDLLQVEAQLTDVRGQIEQLQGQQAQLNDQVAYGTLVTTFGLEVQQVQVTAKGWDPSTDVDAATATLIGAGQAIASAAIWAGIVGLPLLVGMLVLVLAARWLVRRFLPAGPRPGGNIAGWDAGE